MVVGLACGDMEANVLTSHSSVVTGGVLLKMSDLPNGQDCDNWHQLAIPGTRASRGNLRLVATFKHEVILPLEEYRAFSEVR